MTSGSLWTCPRCGRSFANRNQSHACTSTTLEDFLGRQTAEAVAIYRAIEAAVFEIGPARIHPAATRAAFITRMSFAAVYPARRWVDLTINLRRELQSPRVRKAARYTPGLVTHFIRVASPAEVDDEMREWLRDSYLVGLQQHAG